MGTQEATSSSGGRLAVVAMTAVLVLTGAGVAAAGHITSDVVSYTGCLAVSGGTLTSITEGSAPTHPCPKNSVVAHLSGGDVTGVTVGTGLTGGGTNGDVHIGLDPQHSLRQDCGTGQTLKWNGSAWACSADNDTTYSAGTGLTLSGSQFSIAPNHRVTNNQSCASSQFATGLDSTGALTCAAPPTGAQVFANIQSGVVGIPGDLTRTPVVSLNIPAGAYSFIATGQINHPDDDAELNCVLRSSATGTTGLTSGEGHSHEGSSRGSIAMMGLHNFTAATTLTVWCTTNDDDVTAHSFGIQAIRMG